MTTWTYPSKSGGSPYTTALNDDGSLTCNCRGFYVKRGDKPRCCSHIDDVVKRNGLNTVRRGDLLYATEPGAALTHVPEPVDYQGDLAKAEADGYVNPMLASAITGCKTPEELWARLDTLKKGFLWEEKWDGQRAIISVKNHAVVNIWSRPRPGEGPLGLSRLSKTPEYLLKHAAALPDGTYDTEDIVIGGRSWAVTDQAKANQRAFVFFDLPMPAFREQPIEVRRAVLEQVLAKVGSPLLVMSQVFTPGREAVEAIWARGGEGAMIKREGSIYRPGWRSPDWYKVKLWEYSTVTLTHFEKGKEGPFAKMAFVMDDGVVSTCKTLGNKWLAEFAKNGQKYLKQRFVLKHQGRTDDTKKPRHGQFDHFAGEGE